ncbi:MAG: hypothetical protein V1874_00305 [Spirochaetota bacterium]
MRIFNFLFNKKIIIGIHGLANKVPDDLLEEWWIKSIREGLSYIGHPGTSFVFKSVYWSDILYEKPLDINEKNKKSPLYEDEPYLPGNTEDYKNFSPSKNKKQFLDSVEKKLDKLFLEENRLINPDKIADMFIRHLYKDLDFYFNHTSSKLEDNGVPVKNVIRKRLADVLSKYRNKQILLIAHSMGTIVAYDVLTQTLPDANVHTLITLGSPLALPNIIKKIHAGQGTNYKTGTLPSPENISHKWYNFADLNDPVALVYNISDDFNKNSRGLGPEDVIIHNNYKQNGKYNAHKLFGYLRAPQTANAIYDFCISGKPGFYSVLKKRMGLLFRKK